MKKILVLGCGGSAGINFIKSLRLPSEKIKIVGVDTNKYYLEMSPVDKRYLIRHKKGEELNYINKINKVIELEGIEFIHAQPDPEVKIISDYRQKLRTKVFLPSKKAINISQDKWLTHQTLKKATIPVAKTFKLSGESSLKKAFNEIDGSIWLRASKGAGGRASLPVDNFEAAKAWINYWSPKGLKWENFLASEKLDGQEVSWVSIWYKGKLICSQGKERLEWVQSGLSPSGVTGTTAIQKTVHNNRVNKIAIDTVKTLDSKPNGIYVVDTKENKSGIPCVTEVNPGRFFTTSLFFSTIGINMPLIFVKLAYEEVIPKVSSTNSTPAEIYWVRIPDGGPVMIKDNKWTFTEI